MESTKDIIDRLGKVIPASAFVNQPTKKFVDLWQNYATWGQKTEATTCNSQEPDVHRAITTHKDMQAFVAGLDEGNSFGGRINDVTYMYARHSDPAANSGVDNGARMIELTENGDFVSMVVYSIDSQLRLTVMSDAHFHVDQKQAGCSSATFATSI